MSAIAETLIHDLTARGIRLSRNVDRLHVVAPHGALTDDLKRVLAEKKAELLAALPDKSAALDRLVTVARAEGIDTALIDKLADDDLDACAGLTDETLSAYVRALRDAGLREWGKAPPDETAVALCRRCGPVWVAPEVAAVAPHVHGLAHLLGCPWCHVKNRQSMPRPKVTCGKCIHFERDRVNPTQGWGSCSVGRNPTRPYPSAAHECADFVPKGAA